MCALKPLGPEALINIRCSNERKAVAFKYSKVMPQNEHGIESTSVTDEKMPMQVSSILFYTLFNWI